MRGIQFQTFEDRIVVACHAPATVEDSDYAPLLRELERIASARGSVRLVLRTEEQGGPNLDQRAELNKVANYGAVQLAILTDSKWCKGVGAAIRWSGAIQVKCFGTSDLDRLQRWMEVDEAQLEAMRMFMGDVSPMYAIDRPRTSASA